jgi:hypothetical protein
MQTMRFCSGGICCWQSRSIKGHIQRQVPDVPVGSNNITLSFVPSHAPTLTGAPIQRRAGDVLNLPLVGLPSNF